MSRRFKTVSDLQGHLKNSIMDSIQTRLTKICIETVKRHYDKNVNQAYVPSTDSYDRTMELMNSVTVGNISMGYKYAYFEVFMDTEKINPHIRTGVHSYGGWNAHADVFDLDVSEYIPMWVEEGTSGSLHDREPAHYMYDSWVELSGGDLAQELENSLRREGWKVTVL